MSPRLFKCVYGCSDEKGENEDGKDGSEIPERKEKLENALALV